MIIDHEECMGEIGLLSDTGDLNIILNSNDRHRQVWHNHILKMHTHNLSNIKTTWWNGIELTILMLIVQILPPQYCHVK